MIEKSSIIILIGTCAIVVVSVLSYAVFVKPEPVVPVNPPVVNNDVTPTPSTAPIDISDWRVYSNEEFGLEIKYPSTLYLFDCSERFREPNPLYVHFTPYIKDNCNTPGKAMRSVISISVIKDFDKNKIINIFDKNTKEKNIIVGSKSGIQISGDREVLGGEGEKLSYAPIREMIYTVIPFKNDISIQIFYGRIASVKDNAHESYVGKDISEIYKQMLSTFKFTNL